MKSQIETYVQSRREITNYILSFCTIMNWKISLGLNDSDKEHAFFSTNFGSTLPIKDDLILLGSVSMSTKWMLSWYIESRPLSNGDTEYLLKSIEDGSLCWWNNVSISYFSRETTARFPQWKWNDRQYEFQRKWDKAVYSIYDKPRNTIFNEDGSALVSTRKIFNNEIEKEFVVVDWKKSTIGSLKKILTPAS